MATQKYTTLGKGALAAGYTAGDTTITLVTGNGATLPSTGDFVVAIDSPPAFFLKCTARSGDVVTVNTSAVDGTVAANKAAGVAVTEVITASVLDAIRVDQCQTGTLAALPASEKAGNLYLPTDAGFIFRDDGAAQKAWGPLVPDFAPVDLTGFAWTNQGSATIANLGGSAQLFAPASASANLRVYDKAVPATPYTVTAAVQVFLKAANFAYGGIVLRESSTGKLLTLAVTFQNTDFITMSKWTNATTFISGPAQFADPTLRGPTLMFLRMNNDGTTITCTASFDGVNWNAVDTATVSGFIAPTHYGIFSNSQNSAVVYTIVRSLKVA